MASYFAEGSNVLVVLAGVMLGPWRDAMSGPTDLANDLPMPCQPIILTEALSQCTINDIDTDGMGVGMDNNFDGDHSKIFEALEAATHQLAQVNKRLEQLQLLQQRARQLEEFIALGKILTGQATGNEPHACPAQPAHILPETSNGDLAVPRKRTAADYARLALEEAQRPMRAAEMAEDLQRRGLMEGQYVREVLRTAMRKHADFERVSEGLYALKAWPSELKTRREQQTSSLFPPITEQDLNPPLNPQQPLTTCIVELLETTTRLMSPVEIEAELRRRGKPIGKDSLSSALSRLVGERRIQRPQIGKYKAMPSGR
jgi:hypothetical protein